MTTSILAGLRPGSLLAGMRAPRIAIIRSGRLGDMVVSTPAIRALRECVPGAQITLLTHERGLALAQRLRSVDAVEELPEFRAIERWLKGEPEPAMATLVQRMRDRQVDLVLQCSGGGELTNPLALAFGARHSVGGCKAGSQPLEFNVQYHRSQREVDRLLDIMEVAGVPRRPPRFELDVFPEDRDELARVVEPALLQAGRVIGVHVGAGSGARVWAQERVAAVLDEILPAYGLTALLVGGESEVARAADVRAAMREAARTRDLTARLGVGGLIALIGSVRLLLANDSAPAHIASALGTPSVTVFGSAQPSMWAPPNRTWHRACADESAPCRRDAPCGCTDDSTALCIAAVSVSEVTGQVRALLDLLAVEAASPVPGTNGRGDYTLVPEAAS